MTPSPDACLRLEPGSPHYPPRLRHGPEAAAPPPLVVRGDPALLRLPLLALLCSVRVPPALVLPAYDLARALRDAGVPVVGGFQAPLERDCLDYLLRGGQPVVLSPARAIGEMRLPAAWRAAMAEGRMLLVTRFEGPRRPTRALSLARNRLVAALAARILLPHAAPGGGLHRVAAEALARGTAVHCLDHPANRDLVLLGASALDPLLPPVEACRRLAPPPPRG